jgi:hypothetical protein
MGRALLRPLGPNPFQNPVWSEKAEKLNFLAHKEKAKPGPALAVTENSTKAWAENRYAHLGRF